MYFKYFIYPKIRDNLSTFLPVLGEGLELVDKFIYEFPQPLVREL
jgi:hypothetical protein